MSYGDDEHPISFAFEPEERGEHVHVTVRSGLSGMRGLCGTLVLRREDWVAFRHLLGQSTDIDHRLAAAFRYAPQGAENHLSAVRIVHLDMTPFEVTTERAR